ncbi:MAG: MBL fold metallo-hydrolase [Candidatus Altarchaeum sp.]|nr:MBL fold metallo-hydrolase [Candidatus Altarchaeum sp.]
MKIYPIISLSANSNTYLLENEETKAVCIIDPGFTSEHLKRIISALNETKKFSGFIINTHCHYDHIANCEHFNGVKIYLHRNDGEAVLEQNNEKILSYFFEMKVPKINSIEFVDDNEIINLGKTTLKILHTPGHTSGSISVYEEKTKSLFSGDLVFSGGVGRTDLPSGNFEQLKDSIDKILKLNFKTLYSGHGDVGNYKDVKNIRKFL